MGGADPRYFEEHCQPNILRDYTKYKPMDIIMGDYMRQDFVLRAKVVAFMDMRTRAIVGWSLQLTANSTGVTIPLQMYFDRYSLPCSIYFDNGKDFKNHWRCGDKRKSSLSRVDAEDVEKTSALFGEAGVRIIFAKPYHGQSKSFEKTYVSSNTATHPMRRRCTCKK
jgi:hypothetical protein